MQSAVNNTQTRIPGNAQNEHIRYKPGQAVLPLRSALKNSSQTPSLMLPQSQLQPPPQSQQTSPEGSQMGSTPACLWQVPKELALDFLRDVKGKGQETIDGFTDSGAIAIIGSTGADSIPSPPPSTLSTGTSLPPCPISYSLPPAPLGTSPSPAPPALDPPSSIPPIPPNSPSRLVYPDQQPLCSKRHSSGSVSSSDSSGSDSSDAVSILSYETGREVFDDLEDGDGNETETEIGQQSSNTIATTQTQVQNSSSISVPNPNPNPNANSPPDTMTTTPHHGDTGNNTNTPPRRQKSVPVSLQLTYSVTSPAIEYDVYEDDHGDEGEGGEDRDGGDKDYER
ncbi:hypothetical protein C8R41DRAFT_927316 [Lentinula lateritia]|uniref:Uncharacterized protein n=1 Tax=Lentinula lateritia TaxID=40482 RepID=A0ABQ8UW83_9AGAR|nr:hypothetical protein C8R41DRAFT_927316 [Lentinula lateritia]